MAKEIDRIGIPVVQLCSITTIARSVGANRIVPAIAIPYPAGNPELDGSEERDLRKGLVKRCLEALETEVDKVTEF